mgnify:CR=1 FL=1
MSASSFFGGAFFGGLPFEPKRTTTCGADPPVMRSRSSRFHCSPWRRPVPIAKAMMRLHGASARLGNTNRS